MQNSLNGKLENQNFKRIIFFEVSLLDEVLQLIECNVFKTAKKIVWILNQFV